MIRTTKRAGLAGLLLVSLIGFAHPAVAQTYTLTDLGSLGGDVTLPSSINDAGQAVGYSATAAGSHAFLWQNGTMTDLGTLPSITDTSSATSINNAGQIVGASGRIGMEAQAFIWQNGTMTPLGVPPDGGLSVATGINYFGQVVGYGTTLVDRAFLWQNGTYSYLTTESSFAVGISNAGQVALNVNNMAAVWQNGTLTSLGTLPGGNQNPPGGGVFSEAHAVNNIGQVVGVSNTATALHAFLWQNGTMTDLGSLPGGVGFPMGTGGGDYSRALGINDAGQVVGYSAAPVGEHAVLWQNGAIFDLNDMVDASDPLKPFVTLTAAVGISDSLFILATGTDSRTNQVRAYLLQGPVPPTQSIQLAPVALIFGTEPVGGITQPKSVVVTNTDNTTVPLGPVAAASNFSIQSNNCGQSLAPSAQCTITVAFAPAAAGIANGGLVIPTTGRSYFVALSGTAPIATSLSGSANTATVGKSVTLTWAAPPGSSCTASSSSTTSPWSGTLAPSGSGSVQETKAGTDTYQINCTAPGAASSASTSVTWMWPPVTATLSASPSKITSGQSTTLTWTSSNATRCTATGGASADGWSGALATSGQKSVTEPFAPSKPSVTMTYGITCTSSVSGLSAKASTPVVIDEQSKSGGGGVDLFTVTVLLAFLALRLRPEPRWRFVTRMTRFPD